MDDDQNTFDYKASGGTQQPKKRVGSVEWTASEYIDHQQGAGWFLLLAIITIALAVAVYFLIHDYFATTIVVVVGILVGVFAKRTPAKLNYQISSEGLQIQDKTYPFDQFKSFAVIEEGVVSSIELIPLKKFMPPISIFFAGTDRDKIIGILENYLPVEDRGLDGVERISRRLRF